MFSWILLLLLALLLGGIFIGYWIPRWLLWVGSLLYPNVITSLPRQTHSRNIVLTLDDVPYGECTSSILDILDAQGVQAILFVISGNVGPLEKQLLVRAVQRGHVLGNHGHIDHAHALLYPIEFRYELYTCDTLITEIYAQAGVERPARLFRPGSGFFTSSMIQELKEMDYKLVLGSVYPHDPAIRSSCWNAWYIKQKLRARDILILHDRAWTPELLCRILPWAQAQGLVFSTQLTPL